MNYRDSSSNFTHRRYSHSYGSDERHIETNSGIYDDDHHERYNLNQYYNAVEDEQIYMDEYTSLVNRYNEFIINGTTLYNRMEMTLRENITRAIERQSYFYRQSDYLYDRERRIRAERPNIQHTRSNNFAASAASAASRNTHQPQDRQLQQQSTRFGDVFPRLLSRYFSSESARNARGGPNPNNMFSMLYTGIPFEARLNGVTIGVGQTGEALHPGAPSDDQINRATLNTVFSNILSPVNATCPISRDEFNDNSEITMIRGCNHIFNRDSLREWFVSHSTCPMCRNDIREFRPPSLQEQSHSTRSSDVLNPSAHSFINRVPRNLSIDSVDGNNVTFSYDLPFDYSNNEDIYRDILNTVNWMTTNSLATNSNSTSNQDDTIDRRNHDHDNDSDDIMEVD